MEYQKLIKNKIELQTFTEILDKNINVVYCIDDNYSLAAGVSIYSLIEQTKGINISIHLFVLSLSDINKNKFNDIVKSYKHITFTIYYVDQDININIYNRTQFPLSASLRIITPEILKKECQTIIYIDSDTLVLGDLNYILKNDDFNSVISAVIDVDSDRHSKRLNIANQKYFNSGVMVINTKKWSDFDTTNKALNLLSKKNFPYPDQDALNIILYDKVTYISENYNSQLELSNYLSDAESLKYNASIIHYLGPDKPWYRLFMTERYKNVMIKTPWAIDKLKLVPNVGRIRIYSKRMKYINRIKSIKLTILYYVCKIIIVS